MRYCAECGKEIWKNAKFCVYCGTKVPEEGEQILPEETALYEETADKAVPVEEETEEKEEKKYWKKLLLTALAAAVLITGLGITGYFAIRRRGRSSLAGTWRATDARLLTIELKTNGTGIIDNPSYGSEQEVQWQADGGILVLDYGINGSQTFEYMIEGNTLTLVSTNSMDTGVLIMEKVK